MSDYFDAHKGEHIDQYDMPNYVGRRFLADEDHEWEQYGVILVRSYEKDTGCGTSKRTHEFKPLNSNETFERLGSDVTCYLYKE